jgi:hypothetical protein
MENTNYCRAMCVTAVLIFSAMAGCTATNVYTRSEAAKTMQKNGADPLDIPCAIGDGTERYCELRAASKAAASK